MHVAEAAEVKVLLQEGMTKTILAMIEKKEERRLGARVVQQTIKKVVTMLSVCVEEIHTMTEDLKENDLDMKVH